MTDKDIDLRSVSVRLDGRASVEHQIDIHVQDLLELDQIQGITLEDVVEGLQYVLEYHIKGGKQPHLDGDLMRRLLEGLFKHMNESVQKGFSRNYTAAANGCYLLFVSFLQEVHEFRDAVGLKSVTDLRVKLDLKHRAASHDPALQAAVAGGIYLLTMFFRQFADWHEYADDDGGDIDRILRAHPEKEALEGLADQPEVLYPPQALYFDKNAVALAKMFGTDPATGLASDRVPGLRAHYGNNALPAPPDPSVFKMLLGQVLDFMILLLVAAAIVQFIEKDYNSGIVLLVVVVINIIIGFVQEYKASKALAALMSLSVPKATVLRDGQVSVIDSAELVPGDVVVLEEGEAVPADLRLLDVSQLEVIEIVLTGESVPTVKSIRTIRKRTRRLPLGECSGNAFMTTVVAKGRGHGLVVRTGNETEIGKISAQLTKAPQTMTPIQRKLRNLGIALVIIAIVLCVLIIVIGIAWGRDAVEQVKIGISLAVSVIPEGLVAVTTITMAIGVRRMAAQHAIVRKLPSVETLGSVSHICSDKTGTLTEGKMAVDRIWMASNAILDYSTRTPLLDPTELTLDEAIAAAPDVRSAIEARRGLGSPLETTKLSGALPPHVIMMAAVAQLCSNASRDATGKLIGDSTETALVDAAEQIGLTRAWFETQAGFAKLGEYAFTSERKLMSVIYHQNAAACVADDLQTGVDDFALVLVKGAPENILSRCTHYLPAPADAGLTQARPLHAAATTPLQPMTAEAGDFFAERALGMASSGLRVLGFALRRVARADADAIVRAKKETEAEQDLAFIGLIGLIDPPKQGVKESIATCRRAGINVIMITGDHVATASAIARQLGIMDLADATRSRSLKGSDLDAMSDEHLAAMSPFPVVFARVSPDNKLKIVKTLQSMKYSVAMTGDGVNDAPAIKHADVGVAMGISGTEITKQAADIVLADDNFSTIVEAVKEGRKVYDNIRKFIIYLLSCNFAEIMLFLISSICGFDLPFSTIQILWANLIIDIPPSTAIGLEPQEKGIMDRKPRPKNAGIMSLLDTLLIFCQGMTQAVITLVVYVLCMRGKIGGVVTTRQIESLPFAVLGLLQLNQSLMSRSIYGSVWRTGITGNRWLLFAWVFAFSFLVMGIYIPKWNDWLELEPINGIGWGVIFLCVAIHIIVIELMIKPTMRFLLARGGIHLPRLPFLHKKKKNRF